MPEILINNVSFTIPFQVCETCPLVTKALGGTEIKGLTKEGGDISCFILNRPEGKVAFVKGEAWYLNEKTKVTSNARIPDTSGTPPENCPPIQPDFVPEPINISDIDDSTKLDSGRGW